MAAEIINLRQVRKARARAEMDSKAEANRRKFGRTKAERLAETNEHQQAARHLDGHEIERRGDDDKDDNA